MDKEEKPIEESQNKESRFIIIKKSHRHLQESYKYPLPAGRIDKRFTGIGATSYEICDQSRNSIIVCPTVALASSKAIYALEKKKEMYPNMEVFYLGSETSEINCSFPDDIKEAIQSGKRTKILAVVDSFVKLFNSELEALIKHFHLFIDEADTLQIDNVFRPVMEDCFELYFKFPPERRTMITATPIKSALKKLNHEKLTRIIWDNKEKPSLTLVKVNGYIPYLVGRKIKEHLDKGRETKILVAANSFDLIQEIIVAGKIQETDVKILCSEQSKIKAGYLYDRLISGRLPEKAKVVFITSAYFAGVDIDDPVIIHIVSDPRYKTSMLSPQQVYQICGRARKGCQSRYFYFKVSPKVLANKNLKELEEESKEQLGMLINLPDYKKEEIIKNLNTFYSGSFYRLVDGKLKFNYLLFDLRLHNYKTNRELYSKDSNPNKAFSEYFRTKLEMVKTKDKKSNVVLKILKSIKEYKNEMFRNQCLGRYSLSQYADKPFEDNYMSLAWYLLFSIPEEATEKMIEWQLRHLDEYKMANLKKLQKRLLRYSNTVKDEKELEKLLQELDF